MANFPVLPNAPGIPSLAKLPSFVTPQLTQAMNICSDQMIDIQSVISSTPLAPLSDIADQVLSATDATLGAVDLITNYPSSLWSGGIASSLDYMTGALGGITAAIGLDPFGPVELVSDAVNSVLGQASGVLDMVSTITGLPNLTLMVADALGLPSIFSQSPQWGLFKGNAMVIAADSVVSMEYKKNWDVSDYKLEKGAFASYNKVENPFDAVIRFSTGGSEDDRRDFLQSISAIAGDTELYDVLMPEETYPSVNIVGYTFRRLNNQGACLLQVDLMVVEIRETAEEEFTQTETQAPSGTATKNNGTVQTQPPTPQQKSALSSILG